LTTVTLVKDVPASNYYTGGAATKTITLNGVTAMIWNIKKSIIKIHRKKNKNNRTTGDNFNDVPDNKVLDLKNGDETLVIRGWLEDDATDTAWKKAMWLRAMNTSGGPLTTLTIGESGDAAPPKLVFSGSSGADDLQHAFIEDLTLTIKADDTGAITQASPSKDVARIEVALTIYFGKER